MSRAFVKEQDGEPPESEALDLPISSHPNLLTPDGYQRLEARLRALEIQHQKLKAAGAMADLPQLGAVARDLRYLKHRLETAQVMGPDSQSLDRVGFGAQVTVEDDKGKQHSYRIVGEDEADPERGLVSYVSPLARALKDAKVGDLVTWPRPSGAIELEVVAIRY